MSAVTGDYDPYVELERLAPELDRLRRDENADVEYILMWDALLWSDELPHSENLLSETSALAFVARYRTELVLGRENQSGRLIWERSKRLFPNWPGFTEARCTASEQLTEVYERLSREAWDWFEEESVEGGGEMSGGGGSV